MKKGGDIKEKRDKWLILQFFYCIIMKIFFFSVLNIGVKSQICFSLFLSINIKVLYFYIELSVTLFHNSLTLSM